jgi:hypothetical protein
MIGNSDMHKNANFKGYSIQRFLILETVKYYFKQRKKLFFHLQYEVPVPCEYNFSNGFRGNHYF